MSHPHRGRVRAVVSSRVPLALAGLLIASLAACGGGSSDDTDVGQRSTLASRQADTSSSHAVAAGANVIYIDAVKGSDLAPHDGSTPKLAYKTFTPLATIATPVSAIYLNCGTWNDTLKLTSKQLAPGAIVAPYPGSTCLPRITGADSIGWSTGWNQIPDTNLWTHTVPAGITDQITRLYIDSKPMRVAQWPDASADAPGQSYRPIGATDSTQLHQLIVTSDDKSIIGDPTGAQVHIRTAPWLIEDRKVAKYDAVSGTMTLDKDTTQKMFPQQGYVLSGKSWMLSTAGEFVHDVDARTLTLYWTGNPNGLPIEVPTRANAIVATDLVNVTIRGLQADMTTQDVVVGTNLSATTLTGLTVSHGGTNGVNLSGGNGTTTATLTKSTLLDHPVMAVFSRFAPNVTISNNTVTDSGTLGYVGRVEAAIWAGDASIVTGNSVSNTAYQGVRFSVLGGKVTNNVVTGYCRVLSDCGAIYAWAASSPESVPAGQSSTVSNNQVGPATANIAGTIPSVGSPNLVAGIYLDDFAQSALVNGNTVSGPPIGIFVHNGSHHTIKLNHLWLNTDAAFTAMEDKATDTVRAMFDNHVISNDLVPAVVLTGSTTATPVATQGLAVNYVSQGASAPELATTFQKNQIVRFQDGTWPAARVVTNNNSKTVAVVTKTYTTQGWIAVPTADAEVVPPFYYNAFVQELGNEALTDTVFAGWSPWWSGDKSGTFSLVSTTSDCAQFICARFSAYADPDNLHSPPIGGLANGSLYSLSYHAWFDDPAALQGATLSSTDGYTSLGLVSYVNPMSAGTKDLIKAQGWVTPSDKTGRINLKMSSTPMKAANFNHVSLRPVTKFTVAKVDEWAVAVLAGNLSDASVTCATLGWTDAIQGPDKCTARTLDGATITTWPASVTVNTGRLFFRTDVSPSTWIVH